MWRSSSGVARSRPGRLANGKPTTAPLFRAIITRPPRRSYRADTASSWRFMRSVVRRVIASNCSSVGISNSAMNPSPFGADCFEFRRDRGADLHDLGPAKSCLVNKPHRTIWAIQLEFRAPATRPDRMDMRRRMIVGVDRHADVSDLQDGWHVVG